MRTEKQTAAISVIRDELHADSETVNTADAGTLIVTYWRRGEDHSAGQFKITRTGKVTELNAVTRKFYADPGHGWLAVKTSELRELGIYDQITHYSYQKGQTTYLEEDSDAAKYVRAHAARGIRVRFDYKSTDRRSPIRSYAPFRTVHDIEGI